MLSIHDPNIAVNSLIKLIQECLELAITTKKSKRNSNQKPRNNWITPAILNSCNKKEQLYRLWKLNPSNMEIRSEYRKYTKILDKVIVQAKLIYDRDLIKRNSDNCGKLWLVVKKILGKEAKNNDEINYVYNNNNQKITDSKTICNLMNTYFSEIGYNLSRNIHEPRNSRLTLPQVNPKTIFILPTDIYEVTSIINKMKMKSGGVDSINMKTIKTLIIYIIEPIVHIINLSIEKSIWPDALKCADIIPLFKAKDKHIISNYRPISLISNIAKIFEKVIHIRILKFVKESKILSEKQFGFMKNLGTRDALDYITNIIYNKLDKSIPIVVTFLDLAKAFDTVNHKILLDKLYNYGIRGTAHNLITSYLQNRQQRVIVNGTYSDLCEVTTGVPQGTVLGPLFFILFINDMLSMLPEDALLSFADDTAVISTDKTWSLVENRMNDYLNLIYKWLTLNKLSLNVDKTVYITFGNYCNSVPQDFNLFINGSKLLRVEKCKYLGIVIDYRLRWDHHIEFIVSKTKYLTFLFRKMSKVMSTDTLRMIYYAFFHSIVNYGILAWGGGYSRNKNSLQRLQTRLLGIVNKNQFLTANTTFNLDQLYAFESLNFHYNKLRETYSKSISITRNKSILLPKICKTVGSKSSYIKAITIYNSLPNNLKALNNQIARKTALKKWILANM